MKKNVWLLVLLVFLMVMNSVLLYLVLREPDRGPIRPREFITERLGFDEAQQLEFSEIEVAHRAQMQRIDERFVSLRAQLFSDIGARPRAEVSQDSLIGLIGSVSAERELELRSYFKQIEALCTDRQKRELQHIINGALRPGPPGRRPPRNGPPPPR